MAMRGWVSVTRNIAGVLVFGRPWLVFGAFACALWVMFTHDPIGYILGISLLLLALVFDWVDGWFAVRYIPNSKLGPLADRMMDRLVLSIIFPVLAAGMFWRFERLSDTEQGRLQLLHAIFVLAICVLILLRDQLASFLRSFEVPSPQDGGEVESAELTRLRTLLGLPLAVALYAYAFYLPTEGWERFYRALDFMDALPLRIWFVVEILFLVVNITSITLYLRKQGPIALDDISGGDELLRRRILAVIPNALTLMNGALGITAIVFADHGRVREALFILMGAALFDRLDGLAARRLGLTEPLPNQVKQGVTTGAMLDDISDGISFCVAPAVIFYLVMGQVNGERAWWVVLTAGVYLAAGIARLIYFTLDKSPIPGFFKGMPVPAAALFVTGPIEIAYQLTRGDPDLKQPLTLLATALMLLAALAMNLYRVRYLHIGRLMSRRPMLLWVSVAAWLTLVFTPWFGVAVLATLAVYLVSPVFTRQIDPAEAVIEQRVTR